MNARTTRATLVCAGLLLSLGHARAQEAPAPSPAPQEPAPKEPAPKREAGPEVEVALRTGGERLVGRLLSEKDDGTLVVDSGGWRVELPRGQALAIRSADGLRLPIVDMHEDRALHAESRDDDLEAFRSYRRMISALTAAQRAGAIDGAEAAPIADVAISRMDLFGTRIGRSGEIAQTCDRLSKSRYLTPLVRSHAQEAFADALRTLGEPQAAAAEEAELGVLTQFYVVGPFDNERGRGFKTTYPPEADLAAGPKLDATYPGKEAPVSWRPTPTGSPRRGIVDLDALCYPADQALAYAVTYVHVERPTPVALRIGSDEAVKLWVNERLVLSRDLRRTYASDQDSIGAVLQPGWTRVLLKVCDQTDAWQFRLRVTSPSGGRAPVRFATLAEIPKLAAGKTSSAPGECQIDGGSIEALTRWVAAKPRDARAWFRLGYLHLNSGAQDATQHPDREAFSKASTLRPKNANYRMFLSATLGGGGDFSVNAEHNARRRAIEAVLKLDPDHVEARIALANYYLGDLGQVERAAEILEDAPETSLNAQLVWLDVLRGRGQGSLALTRLRTLLDRAEGEIQREESLVTPFALVNEALDEARKRGDIGAQLRLLQERLTQDAGDLWALVEAAGLYRRAGQPVVAEQLLRHAHETSPWEAEIHVALGGLYSGVQRLDPKQERAEAAYRAALAICPQDPGRIETLARVLERRGKRKEARALYEQALRLDPKRVATKRYLEFLDRKAAKVARFEDAWVLDPKPILAAAKEHPLDKRRTHRILLRQRVDRLNPDGTRSTWRQELLRVESREGVQALAGYRAGYQDDQRIEVTLARVHRAAGGTEDAPVGIAGGISRGEFGGGRAYPLRFPPLVPGDAIEVRYRVDDLRQGFFGDYYGEVFRFQDYVHMDHVRVALLAPKARQLYFHNAQDKGPKVQEKTQGDEVVRVWERKGIPPLQPEPNMPWLKEVIPQIQVSTFKDWDVFARWYWGLVKSQHEADEAIKAKVLELTKGAKTTEEKLRRIYNFVVTDIRYSDAWEFGVHGFKPYSATKIYARKFGDCKDKATLIGTMCEVIGVEAHPVLIFGEDGRGREDLTLPLMGHFNHCISYVQLSKDKGLFLDGTAEYHSYGNLPSMDYGARVVVITPDKGLVKEIPYRAAAANAVSETHEVVLSKDGKGKVKSTMKGTGTFEVVLRQLMTTEGRRVQVLEPRFGQRYSGAKVEKVKATNPTNLDEPFQLSVETVLPGMLRKTPEGGFELRELRSWLFDLIYLRNGNLSNLAADNTRTHDLVLPVPSAVDEAVRYTLPEGASVKTVPEAVKLETPFGIYRRVYTRKGGTLEVRRVLQLRTTRVSKDKYAEFRRFVDQIERAERARPVLDFGGGAQ
jgi:tetratricopeptide (TPR) repeat protein